jgi:ATP-dependent helicase HrpA
VDDVLTGAAVGIVDAAGGPPWDAVGFDALVDRAVDDLGDTLLALGDESIALLETAIELRGRLADLPAGRFPEARIDLEDQLDRLVYPGFLSGVGAARVSDVHRYLKASSRRLDRLPEDPDRDAAYLSRVHRLEHEHDRLSASLPPSPELHAIAWMLEELRVSFFAQSLGTRGKVSEKRIERALAAVEAAG